MQKIHQPIPYTFKQSGIGSSSGANNIYSLLISSTTPTQDSQSMVGWNLPKISTIQPLEKKIKTAVDILDDHVNIRLGSSSTTQQQLSPPIDHIEFSSNTDDQTLPNFKQFELQVSKSASSSTSTSPSHEPSFSSIGNSKDFRLAGSFGADNQQTSPYLSYPSSPIDQHNLLSSSSSSSALKQQNERKKIQEWVQELQNLRKRESILLENLKNYSYSDDSDEECHSPSLMFDNSLKSLINNNNTTVHSPKEQSVNTVSEVITVQQQPPEHIVFNKYVGPSPMLVVDQETISKCTGYLIVNASLIYRPLNGKQSVQKVTKGNQDVLQGVKSIIVEKSGVVLFNKLKVNEIQLKQSQSQSFSFYFTLSEISSDNQINVISQVISTPFQFITRNKRKFDEIDSDSQEPSSPQSKNSPICSSPYSPPSPLIQTEQPQPNGAMVLHSSSSSSSSLITKENDNNYIDITELLVLPQKEAAARLGISESMLCKRFKECTKRKWPYRYLKKIDKVIKILSFQNANEMPKDEKEKLERFIVEREECLRPVKIRITGCLEKEDFDFHPSATTSNNSTSNSSTKSQIQSIINDDNNSKMINTTNGDGNGLENILETLEMLKHTTH
ncbi:hypothetical protein DLAC_06985 [Tieghemostelium lacteum]|uniref:RWP-RK domain-containing protein n=1 Tax=Tieghemostelium lacteum TaxID=361077 RepID=A0A151ZDV4_TIELA|nr:hypothetical protein DLAC_06985 [Tieghemostelium lacteum]|eukprot:KYQ92142.1 hypothetical protein DLAC_06985 [Tieghemostelium lacteum]